MTTTSTATLTPPSTPTLTSTRTQATAPAGAVTCPVLSAKHRRRIMKMLGKKSFCTLATSSPAGNPHVAGVIYQWVDGSMWIHSMASSRKARSIAATGRAAVTVPFRRLPAGPPFTIHFQADAQIVPMDSVEATTLCDAGKLTAIAGHGALDEPDGCFVKVTPIGMIHSYGTGASIVGLIRDPLNNGAGRFSLTEESGRVTSGS